MRLRSNLLPDTATTDLLFRPATELAEFVRAGEVSSRELVDASLERIEALNPQLNAFIDLDPEGARAAADAISAGDERPFAGVPLAIKDIGPPWAGHRQTWGSHLFGDFTPDFDGSVVRRFKEAGFVPVGTTNAPEFGILPVTEPARHGPARNPWDPGRTPGGSSGGSASATAAGMVPIAHGNDGGGSIRIPASCCGLVGLKPARGRVSSAPMLGESFLAIDGVVSRTVADTAAALDVLAGYELGDASWAPPPERPFSAAVETEPKGLRIGFSALPPIEADVDPLHVATMEEAARLLESLGHHVEPVEPPWHAMDLFRMFTVMWAVGIGMSLLYGARVSGRDPNEDSVERLSWELYERGRAYTAFEHAEALIALQAFSRGVITALAPYDAFLTPALAQRPVAIGSIDSSQGMEAFAAAARFTPFTAPINVSGQPAISLPLELGEDGLPIAIQLIGRPAGEWSLLGLSAQIERARPWADRRPF